VIEQDPLPSRQRTADRGTAINLVVGSLGDNPVNIPTFRTRENAENFVNENRLRLKRVREEESDATAGTVLRQSPKAGRQFGRNCPVDVEITVAIPIVYVDIENYVDQPINVVEQKLRGLDLYPIVKQQQYSDATPGTVIQQSPAGPTRVRHRSFVYLVVATQYVPENITVPDLCKRQPDKAQEMLKLLGLTLVIGKPEELPAGVNGCGASDAGSIWWQEPQAGKSIPKNGPKVVKVWLVGNGE
jgi:beta-lactam-binding protein with PASTA domain